MTTNRISRLLNLQFIFRLHWLVYFLTLRVIQQMLHLSHKVLRQPPALNIAFFPGGKYRYVRRIPGIPNRVTPYNAALPTD